MYRINVATLSGKQKETIEYLSTSEALDAAAELLNTSDMAVLWIEDQGGNVVVDFRQIKQHAGAAVAWRRHPIE